MMIGMFPIAKYIQHVGSCSDREHATKAIENFTPFPRRYHCKRLKVLRPLGLGLGQELRDFWMSVDEVRGERSRVTVRARKSGNVRC